MDEISSAPGVGKKSAQRLVLELAGRIEKMAWSQKVNSVSARSVPVAASPQRILREDLTSALSNLGYSPGQVKSTLDKLFEREDAASQGFEACLRMALKELSGRPGGVASSTEVSHA